jgi:hypothetical protein
LMACPLGFAKSCGLICIKSCIVVYSAVSTHDRNAIQLV